MKIYLDDERMPPDDSWLLLRHPSPVVRMLIMNEGKVTHLSLDHDLACFDGFRGAEITGYDVLCKIEQAVVEGTLQQVPKLTVHSANPVGRKRMLAAIAAIERMSG